MTDMSRPRMRVASVVLGAPDPRALALFYHRLLDWTIVAMEPARPGFPAQDGWAMLAPPVDEAGLRALSIQWEPDYRPPEWPPAAYQQQLMMHLDIAVDDLDTAVAWATHAGARLAERQ